VLVESPIDALSFAVLDRTESRKTIYLSTDGSGTVPIEFFRQLPNNSVIVAYDNDQPGNLMAQRVMEQLPNAVRRLPKTTDWNEELKSMLSLEQQQQRQQHSERKQNRGSSR
jgi:5S rRNA maturation endonuclease (ribonuclease M5)